jgi:hypothetical protein
MNNPNFNKWPLGILSTGWYFVGLKEVPQSSVQTKGVLYICRGWTKQWKHYRYCKQFFINMVLDQVLPSMQPQSFLEWIPRSSKQPLEEIYVILLEERLQVALEILEV